LSFIFRLFRFFPFYFSKEFSVPFQFKSFIYSQKSSFGFRLIHKLLSCSFLVGWQKTFRLSPLSKFGVFILFKSLFFFSITSSPLRLRLTVNIWRRSGLKSSLTSPYATKIGKFIEFFYLIFALENSMNFPVQIHLNIEANKEPAMRYI